MRKLLVQGVALRIIEQPPDRAVGKRCGHDDARQQHAVIAHDDERQHDHDAIHHRLDEGRRERALNRVDAAEARHHIADVALLEPGERQADHLGEKRRQEAQVDMGAEIDAHPGPHRGDHHLDQYQGSEADAKHRQQIEIAAYQNPVHHELEKERHGDREDLQRER